MNLPLTLTRPFTHTLKWGERTNAFDSSSPLLRPLYECMCKRVVVYVCTSWPSLRPRTLGSAPRVVVVVVVVVVVFVRTYTTISYYYFKASELHNESCLKKLSKK